MFLSQPRWSWNRKTLLCYCRNNDGYTAAIITMPALQCRVEFRLETIVSDVSRNQALSWWGWQGHHPGHHLGQTQANIVHDGLLQSQHWELSPHTLKQPMFCCVPCMCMGPVAPGAVTSHTASHLSFPSTHQYNKFVLHAFALHTSLITPLNPFNPLPPLFSFYDPPSTI